MPSQNLCRMEWERNVLFNNALNTFYLRLYGIRHMVKDHSDSEKGNLLPPHRLLLLINSKGSFICTHRQDNTYHGLCYTSRGALAGTRNSSVGPPHEGSIRRPIAPWANARVSLMLLHTRILPSVTCRRMRLSSDQWICLHDARFHLWRTWLHAKLVDLLAGIQQSSADSL